MAPSIFAAVNAPIATCRGAAIRRTSLCQACRSLLHPTCASARCERVGEGDSLGSSGKGIGEACAALDARQAITIDQQKKGGSELKRGSELKTWRSAELGAVTQCEHPRASGAPKRISHALGEGGTTRSALLPLPSFPCPPPMPSSSHAPLLPCPPPVAMLTRHLPPRRSRLVQTWSRR